MIGIESVEPELKKALFLANDGRSTGLQPTSDCVEGRSVGQHQDEPGAHRGENAIEQCC
jgi:hypothetical protein